MPDPPSVNLFTRYVLEYPWPLTGLLVVAAIVAVVVGLREGRKGPLQIAAVLGLAAGSVLATGLLIVTPTERAEAVTREFVNAAVDGDVDGAMRLFAENALLSVGSPNNPGVDLRVIQTQLERLARNYEIRSNRIRTLRGYTTAPDSVTVHLACRTEVEGGFGGAAPSRWVLRVEQQDDDSWLITRLTAISIAHREPTRQLW